MRKILLGLATVGLFVSSGASSQELEELGRSFVREMRQLESAREDYVDIRRREQEAVVELGMVKNLLDEKLADPSFAPADLQELSERIESVRWRTYELAIESATELQNMH